MAALKLPRRIYKCQHGAESEKLETEDTMDTGKDGRSGEQEWQWCLVGNIVREHELGFLDG